MPREEFPSVSVTFSLLSLRLGSSIIKRLGTTSNESHPETQEHTEGDERASV